MFFFQSSLYSYGVTNEAPDGLWGPVTHGLANKVRAAVRLPAVASFTPDLIGNLAPALQVLVPGGAPPRLVPSLLPRDLVDQINRDASAAVGGAPLLSPLQAVAF